MITCIKKTFFIVLGAIMSFQLYGMLPVERNIIAFMNNPTVRLEGSSATIDDIKGAYLLSLIGWNTIGTKEFREALGQHIENSTMFVLFRRFMEQSSPSDPSYSRQDNEDGSGILKKEFNNNGHEYSMQQDSRYSGKIKVLNQSLQCFYILPISAVYPQFIKRD